MSTLAFSSDVNGSGLHQAMIIFCFYKCVKTAQAGCKGIHLCFWIFQTTERFSLVCFIPPAISLNSCGISKLYCEHTNEKVLVFLW